MGAHSSIGEENKKLFNSRTSYIIILLVILIPIIIINNLFKGNNFTSSFTISFLISILTTHYGLKKLKRLEIKQVIRKEGPKKHLKKLGTPTMGGLFPVITGVIIGNIININSENKETIIAITFITVSFMFIGYIDDYKSLKKKANEGLSPKNKILLQSISGILFLIWAGLNNLISPEINLWFKNSLHIGVLIWPLALFILLAESNATNLTDGLDGLAAGSGSLVFTGLAIELCLKDSSQYIPIAKFCICMAGSYIGFLFLNKNPAKIFMGDTGSLALGGALAGIAIISNSLWALFIMGGLFLIESLSVIIQVSIYKITKFITGEGYRLFLMAPLHHHFELKGFKEINIVKSLWILSLSLIILSLLVRSTL